MVRGVISHVTRDHPRCKHGEVRVGGARRHAPPTIRMHADAGEGRSHAAAAWGVARRCRRLRLRAPAQEPSDLILVRGRQHLFELRRADLLL